MKFKVPFSHSAAQQINHKSYCCLCVSGAVDLLQSVGIAEKSVGQETGTGISRVEGFCPLRALRDGEPVANGRPDLAYKVEEAAQLSTLTAELNKVFPGNIFLPPVLERQSFSLELCFFP